MSSALTLLLTFSATFIAIKLVLLIVTTRLIRLQLWAPHTVVIGRNLPAEWQTVLDYARPALQAEGFRYTHTRKHRSINANELDQDSYYDVYYHDGQDLHAEVHRSTRPTPLHACDIYLVTRYQDGRTLIGTNGLAATLIPYPASVTLHDAWAATFAEQLHRYLQARESMAGPRSAPHQALACARQLADRLWPELVQQGQCYRDTSTPPGTSARYRLRLSAALRYAWRIQRGEAQHKKLDLARKKALPALPPEVVQALDRISFVRAMQATRSMVAPRWYQTGLLLLSATAFLALGCWWWGWHAALALAAVVLLHELGHYLVMRWGNFRDVQVFFLPGLGGATSGEKHEASPLLHLVVYLAGPLPGLILALAVLAWLPGSGLGPGNIAYTPLCVLVLASILINGLNLLPVLPLDGGRIVSLLIMQRLPWFRFGFTAISALTLLYVGWDSRDGVTIALSVLLLIGLPHQFRLARAMRALLRVHAQWQIDVHDFRQVCRALQQFVEQLPFGHLNHTSRVTLGLALLPAFMGRWPSMKEALAGLAIYAASIIVPLLALFGILVWQPDAVVEVWRAGSGLAATEPPQAQLAGQTPPAQAAQAQMQAKMQAQRDAMHQRHRTLLAKASAGAARFAAMKQAIIEAQDEYDDPTALTMARQLYAETATLPAPARERAHAAKLLADNLPEQETLNPEQLALLREAESLLRERLAKQEQAEDGLLLALVLKTLANLDRPQQVPLLAQGLLWQEKFSAANDWELLTWRNRLANLYAEQGQIAMAETLLRRNLNAPDWHGARHRAAPNNNDLQNGRDGAIWPINYGWFLFWQKRPAEAQAQIAPELTRPEVTQHGRHAWAEAHLLAAMIAREQRNWSEVVRLAKRMIEQRSTSKTGHFWLDLWLRLKNRDTQPSNMRAALLLLEAQRALGDTRAADKLLSHLQIIEKKSTPIQCALSIFARQHRQGGQALLADALLAIEKRELHCVETPANTP
jgi:Zn-dependent protease